MMRLMLLLAAAAACCPLPCAPLGRLFTSPQQRAQLDALRTGNARPAALPVPPGLDAAPAPPAAAVPPAPLELNGIVRRSDGRNTVWLNRTPQDDGAGPAPAGQSLSLRLPSGKQLILRPGQRYDPATDKIKDAHEP